MKRKNYFYYLLLLGMIASGEAAYSWSGLNTTDMGITLIPPITVTGRITDEDGRALGGVNITLKGTKITATSNSKGTYTMNIPDGTGTLIFSYIGYSKREIPVQNKSVIDMRMVPDQTNLNQVVVIGYGTQKQRDVTSSISTLKGKEIEKYNSPTFQTALQGQLPGVEMYESSGIPGAAVNIRIRGTASINGSAGPLYVVDGIPVFQGQGGDGDGPQNNGPDMGSSTNVMTDINPNDIESIEVLKDAASSAIYGARGAGGVILITTKRGKTGVTSFNVSVINGYSQIAKEKQLLNGPQLLEIFDEAYRNTFYSVPSNANLPLPASPLPPLEGLTRGMADTTNNNAFDHVLQTGVYRELTVSATNGTEKTKYYLSGTYKQNKATIAGSDMQQFNFKLNIDHQLSKRIKIGASITPSYNVENRLGSSSTFNLGGYGGALTTNLPIYPYYNADGTYFNTYTNPEAFKDRNLFSSKLKRSRIQGSVYLEATISKSLKFMTNAQREDWNQVAPTLTAGVLRVINNDAGLTVFANEQKGQSAYANSYGVLNSFDSYFTFNKMFAKNHSLNIVAGMRFSAGSSFYEAMYGEGFINSNLIYPSQTSRVSLNNGFQTGAQPDPNANLGYYSRANYSYKRRYLFSAVINRDGNSRFGGNRRFGTFPAFSAGWIMSDEKFMKNNGIFSFVKIRGSYGLTGNSGGIGNLSSLNTWQTGNSGALVGYMGTSANMPSQPANTELHWEKGEKFDAGIDLGFFKDRISTTIDVYKNNTSEMLLSVPVPVTYGYGASTSDLTFLENRGALYNKGVEFSIKATILKGAFNWNSTFNISHNETRIISLGGLTPNTVSGGTAFVQLYPGEKAPIYYLINWAGVDPVTGGEQILDKDGNVKLATSMTTEELDAARKPQFDKPAAPKFYGGFGNVFSYKAFSLNVFFSYRYGNYLLDVGEQQMSYVGNISATNNSPSNLPNVFLGNLPVSILNRWTPENTITDIPKVYYNDGTNNPLRGGPRPTTRFLSDASYLRLKNIQFSYTLPEQITARLKLKSARINVTGQNLLMFTKFKGADPEAVTISTNYRDRNISYGVIRNAVPQTKTLTIGFNVGF